MCKDGLEQGNLEGLQFEFAGVAPVERLGAIEENLVDEAIDAAADDEIYLCARVIGIPDILDIAEDSRLNAVEFLKLVNDQREGTANGFGEDDIKDFLESFTMSCDMNAEDVFGFFLKGSTLDFFRFARYQKIEAGCNAVVESMVDEFGLADATAAGNNRKARRFA